MQILKSGTYIFFQTCGVGERSYNFGMLQMLIDRCAQALLAGLKLQPGDKIGLILPNIPEFAVICHGAMKAGLIVTFANPLYTAGKEYFCNLYLIFYDCLFKSNL